MTPLRSLFVAPALTSSRVGLIEKKSISGSWSLEKVGESHFIVLAENFKAKNGPDLKIFLSSETLSEVTGKTATKGSLLISELRNAK